MKPISVILVDDHTLVRAGIRVLVQKIPGVTVVAEANDGEVALQLVEKHKPTVVLLDIEMPGANGLEVTKQIAQSWPDTCVIILSMHGEQEYVLRALRAGAKGYLLKGSNASELELAIAAVTNDQTYLSPAVAKHVVSEAVQRGNGESSPVDRLTPRQKQVLQLIAEGKSRKEISNALGVGVKTVDTYRAQLMEQLRIHEVAGLVRFAIRHGLIKTEEDQKK